MQSKQEPCLTQSQIYNLVNEDNGHDSALSRLLDVQETLRMKKSTTITFSKPIAMIGETPFLFPNTISIIQGQKGQHKSRLSEHIASACLCKNKSTPDPIGLIVDGANEYVVVLIDTERNLNDQLPYALQTILLNAGYQITDNDVAFEYTSLLNEDRYRRYEALDSYISHLRTKYNDKHFIVILDVMSDCIENFNDPASSLKLVDMMNRTINEQNVSYICVIHENPGSEKARGHLGSEVVNKASLVLQIGSDKSLQNTDVIKLSFLHCRSIKRPEPIFLVFDIETKRLSMANPADVKQIKSTNRKKLSTDDLKSFMASEIVFPIEKKDLFEAVSQRFSLSKRTIDDLIKEICESDPILEIDTEKYAISKKSVGREIEFLISKIEEDSLDYGAEFSENNDSRANKKST